MAWNIEAETGYKPKTTFWDDFSIADRFGIDAVKDTFKRAFEEWKENVEYLTELVMVLNWKMWQHHDGSSFTKVSVLEELYCDLWQQADEYACENLKGDDLAYFYRTTD